MTAERLGKCPSIGAPSIGAPSIGVVTTFPTSSRECRVFHRMLKLHQRRVTPMGWAALQFLVEALVQSRRRVSSSLSS